MLLHFYSDNCVWCDKLEAGAYRNNGVSEFVNQNFVAVKVHGTKNPKLTSMFKVKKFPTDVIVTTDGKDALASGQSTAGKSLHCDAVHRSDPVRKEPVFARCKETVAIATRRRRLKPSTDDDCSAARPGFKCRRLLPPDSGRTCQASNESVHARKGHR